jgi:hypothetical protein
VSNTQKDFGADRALVASDQARSGLGPSGFDHGYGRQPQTVRQMFEASAYEGIVEDVTAIARGVRYIEVAPARLFDASLLSELADASDRLAAKVADLQERKGANR